VLPSLSFRANEVSREIYTLSILFPVISAKRSLGYARDDSFVKILKLPEKWQFVGALGCFPPAVRDRWVVEK
ncbi:MAG: hypothetical protein J6Q30_04120, partial [Oscillospiraceae bacterium]|nr:hypothetical protein [Oscillospiraceae bacterium]